MQKVTGSIGSIDDNMFDCGCLFEYIYGKLVALKLTGLIFTDQTNAGNCGYLNVDYHRKYTITHNGTTKTFYIKNNKMIKILDFDQFKIDTSSKLIYHQIDDIISEGGKIFNQDNNFVGFDNLTDFFNNKVKNSEKFNFVKLMYNFRKMFKDGDQLINLINVFDEHLPDDYKIPPTDDKEIREYKFTY